MLKYLDIKLRGCNHMRKIIVREYITLDGVIQAPGGPEEGFKYGGWSAPYYDEVLDKLMEKYTRQTPHCFWEFVAAKYFPESISSDVKLVT